MFISGLRLVTILNIIQQQLYLILYQNPSLDLKIHLCFWPPLKIEPLGPMLVLYPSGSFLINSSAFAVCAACATLSMSIFVIRSLYPMFSAIVPEKSVLTHNKYYYDKPFEKNSLNYHVSKFIKSLLHFLNILIKPSQKIPLKRSFGVLTMHFM